ncbi:hypothetical protein CL96_gp049 [Mycobacterium phage Firecracker]|uniref:Uncharacterized protein n=1 Tax=Mycobacterium phage Firecracker TaxID=2922998 RepID=G8I431_9CAUD|nr:hypothetical protein CL96_gp049 [Mycobacterium phage Firecracker]AER47475.1 hypothetical protein FIRECRACKER_49 [Mycobacterium phage Firecracker]
MMHIGRSWVGHAIEDDCPCPKAPCGLVIANQAICEEHTLEGGKTMRQGHPDYSCPGEP